MAPSRSRSPRSWVISVETIRQACAPTRFSSTMTDIRRQRLLSGAREARGLAVVIDIFRGDGLLMLFPGSATEAAMRRFRDEPYWLT
jgi:hypothetical protein